MWANGKYEMEASIAILLVKKIPEASPIFCVCYFFCDLKILLLGCDSDKFIFCLHKDSQNSGFKEII